MVKLGTCYNWDGLSCLDIGGSICPFPGNEDVCIYLNNQASSSGISDQVFDSVNVFGL